MIEGENVALGKGKEAERNERTGSGWVSGSIRANRHGDLGLR